jgi:uncharacterized C2H2 Zn-finger protein
MKCVICHPRNNKQVIPKFVHCPRCGKDYSTRKNGDIVTRKQSIWIEVTHCVQPHCWGKTNTKLK